MGKDPTEFDAKQAEQPQNDSANADLEAEALAASKSLESHLQDRDALVYRDDPSFRDILLHFQNAKWDECLEKINQFLIIYPEDNYLLAFKQEVEIRLKLQEASQQQQAEENLKRRQRLGVRTLIVVVFALVALILIVGTGKVYQAVKFEREASLTAESLAAKYKNADYFMDAGRPEEALRLYSDIQQIDPAYKDIDQKIELAKQSITVADLYQQGIQALKVGKSEEALEILLKVEKLQPKYKDTPQLILKIEQEQRIASLVQRIQDSYTQGDWAGVVHAYEAIQEIRPFIQIPELKDMLFISYQKLILDIAGRSDVTLEDIETAEQYYRNALALFPQSKEYANERAELQKITSVLLANKYYLHAISLLESSNYSIEGLQEAIRVLTKANDIGSDSPAIRAGIEKAQLFLDSYDNLLQRRWDKAISGFESLYRKEENFADGRVKYFLYEAYTARGDLLFLNADFEAAFGDYQEAEKFAWGDEGNLLRLFQIEVRIAASLRKLERVEEAVEFYHYAFEQLGYQNRLTGPEERELLHMLDQADLAYQKGDEREAIRLYETAMKQEEKLYDQTKAAVKQGDTLANIAFENGTTLESLRITNHLGESMIIGKDQEILVPVLLTSGQ